jgi:hypothetical protein
MKRRELVGRITRETRAGECGVRERRRGLTSGYGVELGMVWTTVVKEKATCGCIEEAISFLSFVPSISCSDLWQLSAFRGKP